MSKTVRAVPASTTLIGKPGEKAEKAKPSIRADAGDVSEASERVVSGRSINLEENHKFPVNVYKRLNALRNLHMSTREKELSLQVEIFKKEAEHYRNIQPLLTKRTEIVNGTYEPTGAEVDFKLSEKAPIDETAPDDGQKGVPKFWLVVLTYAAHTADLIQQQDLQVLEFLKDVRVEYSEAPLGFTLSFEFTPNSFFSNTTLTRSYEYTTNLTPAQLYQSSGLMPSSTKGCEISWKEGKDVTQQNGQKLPSFFNFFAPEITDLSQIGALLSEGDDEELLLKAEQAGVDYEVASALRARIIPRALLFYTGEADTEGLDESDYTDDYSENASNLGDGPDADDGHEAGKSK